MVQQWSLMSNSVARDGAKVSRKQLLHSVVRGSLVVCAFGPEPEQCLTGYLGGMDDYHWLIVNRRSADAVLVHKARPWYVSISIIKPFRTYAEGQLSGASK
jgi:hypothetical protein